MVTQLINVIVNSQGFVTVQKQLSSLGDSAKTTTTYLNSMRAMLAAAMTFTGLNQIIQVVDTFTQLQNRLKLVTDGTEDLNAKWTELVNIANSSYSSIESTVTLYQRVAQAFKAWGDSAEDAMEFTDLFQKAAVLSGSSVQTTAQAVYQFGQALNKGKLDGDEFKSVLEGLPYVAKLIQDSLGVTRAELYEMSADGKISVERLKEAFTDAAAAIRGDFSKVTPTIGMALVVLENKWTEFIGKIQTGSGIFTLLARAILLVADNLGLFLIALTPVIAALTYLGARVLVGLVVTGLTDMMMAIRTMIPVIVTFNATLWANPLVLVVAGIVAFIAAIVYFRNEIGLTNEALSSFWIVISTVFTSIVTYMNPINVLFALITGHFLTWEQIISSLGVAWTVFASVVTTVFQAIATGVKQAITYIGTQLVIAVNKVVGIFQEWYGLVGDVAGLFSDLLAPAINLLQPYFSKFWEYARPAFEQLSKMAETVYEWIKKIGDFLANDLFNAIKTGISFWVEALQNVLDVIQMIISALRTAISLMRSAIGMGSGMGGGGGGGAGANYGLQGYAGEFNTGGGFKVGGTGAGRDTTAVSFRANRGERVTVETKRQQREADNSNGGAASVNVPVQITNVLDPNIMVAAMDSSSGQRSIVNIIAVNRDEILNVLGVA